VLLIEEAGSQPVAVGQQRGSAGALTGRDVTDHRKNQEGASEEEESFGIN